MRDVNHSDHAPTEHTHYLRNGPLARKWFSRPWPSFGRFLCKMLHVCRFFMRLRSVQLERCRMRTSLSDRNGPVFEPERFFLHLRLRPEQMKASQMSLRALLHRARCFHKSKHINFNFDQPERAQKLCNMYHLYQTITRALVR